MLNNSIITSGYGQNQLIILQGYGDEDRTISGGGRAILVRPELLRRRRIYNEQLFTIIAPIFQQRSKSLNVKTSVLKNLSKTYSLNTRLTHNKLIDILEAM